MLCITSTEQKHKLALTKMERQVLDGQRKTDIGQRKTLLWTNKSDVSVKPMGGASGSVK